MKLRIVFFIIIFLTIFFYTGACRHAGGWIIKEDQPSHADAMMLLMGSVSDRVLHAVDLYEKGVSDEIILVETGLGASRELEKRGASIVRWTEQIRNAIIDLGVLPERVKILPGNAQSTQDEALIIKEYLDNTPDIDTLLLITSAPHTRRAHMIFNRVYKKSKIPVCFLCSPSSYTTFNSRKWWKSKNDMETVLLEYIKIANFLIFDQEELKNDPEATR